MAGSVCRYKFNSSSEEWELIESCGPGTCPPSPPKWRGKPGEGEVDEFEMPCSTPAAPKAFPLAADSKAAAKDKLDESAITVIHRVGDP